LPGLPVESVLARGVTWEDFCRFLHDKLVWMTPHVYISCLRIYSTGYEWVLVLGGSDTRTRMCVRVRSGSAAAAAAAPCDFAVRLLAASELRSVYIRGIYTMVPPPVSGETLSLFFQGSRSCLRQVTLELMALSEDQCRALATMSRLDVELNLRICRLADDDAAERAFVDCLQRDKGPIQLSGCQIASRILADALTGDSRVNKLALNGLTANAEGVVYRALANNRGLVDLDLADWTMSDENWTILCESLKAHPTLTSLDLHNTRPTAIMWTDEQKKTEHASWQKW
jgi:hypothetical protein